MRRITQLGIAAVFPICLANTAPAAAEISLIGAWQHCEPVKGCLKFAFLPNGHVIEQFPLAGSVITAYGHYHIRGTVLKIGWHRFACQWGQRHGFSYRDFSNTSTHSR